MLKNTFSHIFNETTESQLWKSGFIDWDNFETQKPDFLSPSHYSRALKKIYLSRKNLELENLRFFYLNLKKELAIRTYKISKPVFLDIETTGLSFYDDITIIGLYDGKETYQFVKGRHDFNELNDILKDYNSIISFNGIRFDVPFISRKLGIDFSLFTHIDLMYSFKRFGLKGGLKKIEKHFNIDRHELSGLRGSDAVRLWRAYEKGDKNSLDILLQYNEQDIINLKLLADICFDMEKKRFFDLAKL